jgi:metal-responsive CopG/Arc/MetJ family transcriptional regulator
MVTLSSFQTKIRYDQLVEMDKYWQEAGFTNRSEFVRLAVRFYMEKHRLPKPVQPPPPA